MLYSLLEGSKSFLAAANDRYCYFAVVCVIAYILDPCFQGVPQSSIYSVLHYSRGCGQRVASLSLACYHCRASSSDTVPNHQGTLLSNCFSFMYTYPQCLSLLVVNSPYPHLSEPYLTRICNTIEPLAANKGEILVNYNKLTHLSFQTVQLPWAL